MHEDPTPRESSLQATIYNLQLELATVEEQKNTIWKLMNEMSQALTPFAKCAEVWTESDKERIIHVARKDVPGKPDLSLTVGDLIRAARVLNGK